MTTEFARRILNKSGTIITVYEAGLVANTEPPREQSNLSSLPEVANPPLSRYASAKEHQDGSSSDSGSSVAPIFVPPSPAGDGVDQQQPQTQAKEEEENPAKAAVRGIPIQPEFIQDVAVWAKKELAKMGTASYSASSLAGPALGAAEAPLLLEDVDETSKALQVGKTHKSSPKDNTSSALAVNISPARKKTRLGEIQVTSDLKQIFPDLKSGTTIFVQTINPKRIRNLSRLNKAQLMNINELVAKKQQVSFEVDGKCFSKKHVFHRNGSDISMSALLALSVAARNELPLFVELVGCAPPAVMEELMRFCRPPLMKVSDVPKLVHVVADCTEHLKYEPDQSIARQQMATEHIAHVLKKTKKNKSLNYRAEFENQFMEALGKPTSEQELAIQMALTAIGVEKYVQRGVVSLNEKSWAYTLLQSGIGLFAFNPAGAVVGAVSLPIADKVAISIKGKKAKRYQKIQAEFNTAYNYIINEPNFRKRQTILVLSENRKTVRRAILDGDIYDTWFTKIQQFAGNRLAGGSFSALETMTSTVQR